LKKGARSITDLVEVGRKRLQIAENALDVAIFAGSCTPEHERAAFYTEKRTEVRAKRAAEFFNGQSVSQKQQSQQARQLQNTCSAQFHQIQQPAFDDDGEETADESHQANKIALD
jgi:RecA/RadA recombinase